MRPGLLTMAVGAVLLGGIASAQAQSRPKPVPGGFSGLVLFTTDYAVLCQNPYNIVKTRNMLSDKEGLRKLGCVDFRPGVKVLKFSNDPIDGESREPFEVLVPLPGKDPAKMWAYPFAFTYADGSPLPWPGNR